MQGENDNLRKFGVIALLPQVSEYSRVFGAAVPNPAKPFERRLAASCGESFNIFQRRREILETYRNKNCAGENTQRKKPDLKSGFLAAGLPGWYA